MTASNRAKHPLNEPLGDRASARSRADGEIDWAGRRKAQPANIVLPSTRRWMSVLPLEYRPQALPIRFARIANALAAKWGDPGDCAAYLASLLHDQRGGRQGFPAEVVQDIQDLRACYARLHPVLRGEADAVTKR